jgi:periplasmic divalent cation tolerance protein
MKNLYYGIYTTFSDFEEAKKVGKQILEEKLAACVNIIPGVTSIYRWKGQVMEEQELVMWIKTSESLIEEVKKLLNEVHSYELPAFAVYKIDSGSEKYLQWINDETQHSNIND